MWHILHHNMILIPDEEDGQIKAWGYYELKKRKKNRLRLGTVKTYRLVGRMPEQAVSERSSDAA